MKDLMGKSQAELRRVIRLVIIKLYVIMQAKYFSDRKVSFICEENMILFPLVIRGMDWNRCKTEGEKVNKEKSWKNLDGLRFLYSTIQFINKIDK